jgi:S1-C subfamily serine protease
MFVMLLVMLAVPAQAPPAVWETATVRVSHETPLPGGHARTQHGSGTVVKVAGGKAYVLTCRHVVEEAGAVGSGKVKVALAGKPLAAKVLGHDRARDLALLEVPNCPPGVAAVKVAAAESFGPALVVWKAGYPRAGPLVVLKGKPRPVVSWSPDDPAVKFLVASPPAVSGDSGGGVFRESDGALVGVVWGGLPDGLRATRVEDVRAFFKRLNFSPE